MLPLEFMLSAFLPPSHFQELKMEFHNQRSATIINVHQQLEIVLEARRPWFKTPILIHNSNTWSRFFYVYQISYPSTAGIASFNIFLRVVNISSSVVYLQVTPLRGWSCKIDDSKQRWSAGMRWWRISKPKIKYLRGITIKFNAPFWRIEWSRSLTFCNLRTKIINTAFRLIHNSQNVMFWIYLIIHSNSVRILWCIQQNWFFILLFSFTLCMLLLCKFFSNLTFNKNNTKSIYQNFKEQFWTSDPKKYQGKKKHTRIWCLPKSIHVH